MPKLIVEAGKDVGREYPVEPGMRLGRLDTCAVALDDTNASREHAEIRDIDGVLHVVDLGSRNGTIVNGKKVKQAALAGGDKLAIGDTLFVFYDEDAPAAAATDSMGPEQLKAAMEAGAAAEPAEAEADSRDESEDGESDDEREAARARSRPVGAAAIRAEGARPPTQNERALELSLFALLLFLSFLCVSYATQILLRLLG